MQPFLAMITPVASTSPQPPLGIWGGGNVPFPTPPMAPGGGGHWGQANDPGYGIDSGLRPTHPIYNPAYPDHTLPGQGLGTWGGGNVPMPSPPIYIPPEGAPPPLGIWGPTDPRPGYGLPGPQPHPEHPIVLPPNLPPVIPPEGEQPERKIEWKTAWTPTTGWIVVGIPAEGVPVPTPSKK